MNIAILTTWNSACGIAEYSKNLVEELSLMGHNILLLTNKGEDTLDAHPRTVITPVFGVSWWGENPAFNDTEAIFIANAFEHKFGPIDVLHVQYQSSLYEPEGFNRFISGMKCKKVITLHDSSVNVRHNLDVFNYTIVHNKSIPGTHWLPFPTTELEAKVFSFGMGRNDYAFIEKACKEIGVSFEGHDARKDGWLPEHLLFEKMNDADAIVLWYNDVNLEGQSAALRAAISSMRPVIVNDVGWFKDAPNFVTKVRTDVIASKAHLQAHLIDVLHISYIRENSFEELAKKHIEVYNGK
jgi:hypothetical protein